MAKLLEEMTEDERKRFDFAQNFFMHLPPALFYRNDENGRFLTLALADIMWTVAGPGPKEERYKRILAALDKAIEEFPIQDEERD